MVRIRRAVAVAAALLSPVAAMAVPEGPAYPSPAWMQRELANYARVLQAPAEQVSNPAFVARWSRQSQSNFIEYGVRSVQDPSWLLGTSPLLSALLAGPIAPEDLAAALEATVAAIAQDPASGVALSLNSPLTPLCTLWSLQCTGDPFRYPGVAGPDGTPFYSNEADVLPVVWYDRECARISGHVWAPKRWDHRLPGIVLENGSVEAPETLYWWAAQALVRSGYVVMTFDPRGQGRSDFQSPAFGQGSNVNPAVFWDGLVDAIDFFRSRPGVPYPHNRACAGTYPTAVNRHNPLHARIDRGRLGIVGHSLGATGVSVVQGYGAPGAAPWPGLVDETNPVKVAVAWDGLSAPGSDTAGGGGALDAVPLVGRILAPLVMMGRPAIVPRVPAMGHSSEYGLTPAPFLQAPDPEGHKAAFAGWRAAGVPAYEIVIQGSSHYEWSLIPSFPTTSWCPDTTAGECRGGWGNPMAEHYTLAWLDRWLKRKGEPGYATAVARLLDDDGDQGRAKMSFYFRSARSFPDRRGRQQACEDIRAGCS